MGDPVVMLLVGDPVVMLLLFSKLIKFFFKVTSDAPNVYLIAFRALEVAFF